MNSSYIKKFFYCASKTKFLKLSFFSESNL